MLLPLLYSSHKKFYALFFVIPQPWTTLVWKDISQQLPEGMKNQSVRARPVSYSTKQTTVWYIL